MSTAASMIAVASAYVSRPARMTHILSIRNRASGADGIQQGRRAGSPTGLHHAAREGVKRTLSPSLRSTDTNHQVDAPAPAARRAAVATVDSVRNSSAGSVTIKI